MPRLVDGGEAAEGGEEDVPAEEEEFSLEDVMGEEVAAPLGTQHERLEEADLELQVRG